MAGITVPRTEKEVLQDLLDELAQTCPRQLAALPAAQVFSGGTELLLEVEAGDHVLVLFRRPIAEERETQDSAAHCGHAVEFLSAACLAAAAAHEGKKRHIPLLNWRLSLKR